MSWFSKSRNVFKKELETLRDNVKGEIFSYKVYQTGAEKGNLLDFFK